MKNILLTAIVIGGIGFVLYILNPLFQDSSWKSYKNVIGSENFCYGFSVADCPDICEIRASNRYSDDNSCHSEK